MSALYALIDSGGSNDAILIATAKCIDRKFTVQSYIYKTREKLSNDVECRRDQSTLRPRK